MTANVCLSVMLSRPYVRCRESGPGAFLIQPHQVADGSGGCPGALFLTPSHIKYHVGLHEWVRIVRLVGSLKHRRCIFQLVIVKVGRWELRMCIAFWQCGGSEEGGGEFIYG